MATITFRRLRELAEAASGLRHKALGIRFDQATQDYMIEEQVAGTSYEMTLAGSAHVMKPAFQVNLPEIDATRVPGVSNGDFHGAADALFWSRAAIEKFVMPYYAGFKEMNELQAKVMQPFDTDPNMVAVLHLPDSETIDASLNAVVKSRTAGLMKPFTLKPLF